MEEDLLYRGGDVKLGVDRRRWALCALQLAMGSMQGAGWMVFSASDEATRRAFGLSGTRGSLVIDWFMNVGTITFVVCLPYFSGVLRRRGALVGPHRVLTLAGWHGAVAASLFRCAAVFLRGSAWGVGLAYVASILNGAAAPGFYFASALAELWFPETERFVALAVLAVPGTVGPLLAFGCALFVETPRDLAVNVYIQAAVSVGLGGLWVFWAPVHPERPPSAAAARAFGSDDAGGTAKAEADAALFPRCGVAVWKLAVAAGASSGFFQAWTDSIADALHGSPRVDESQAQLLGLVANVGNLVGGLLVGPLVVALGLQRKLRTVVLGGLGLGLACYGTFAATMPLGASAARSVLLWPAPFAVLTALVGVASAAVGSSLPVFYDLAAELSFPDDTPAPSAAAINYALNGIQVLLLALLAFVPTEAVSVLMTLVSLAAIAFVATTGTPTYARLDRDERARDRHMAVNS